MSKKIKQKGGRPRKGRTGLPQVNMIDAIKYTKKAFDTIGTTLKSFSGMAQAMGLSEAFAKRAFGELKDYGLIEQESLGWRITDLGRRAVQGDKNAVIEILSKNDILQDLFNNFKDKSVSKDYLEDYIKKKRYRYNINAELVAERFLETMEYINKLEVGGVSIGVIQEPKIEWLKVIQLKYALSPPKPEEISALANEIAEELSDNEDASIRILSTKIKQNLKDVSALKLLINSIVDILSEKYPNLIIKPKEKKQKSPEKEESEIE
jgi:hypothetical protein